MNEEDARRRRAELRRARATLTVTTLAESRPPTAPTAAERLAMVWPLTREAWSWAGKPIPDYRREDAPGRLFRAKR